MSDVSQAVKLVDVACDVGVAAEKLATTPGSLIVKLATLWPLMGDVQVLSGVDYPAVLAEVKALDVAGEAALVAELGAHLKLGNAAVAGDIVSGIELLYEQEQLVEKFVAYGKKLKG